MSPGENEDDAYLWDNTGTPDAQVRRLERLLEPHGLKRPFPMLFPRRRLPARRRSGFRAWARAALIPAGIAAGVLFSWKLGWWQEVRRGPAHKSYVVSGLHGVDRVRAGEHIVAGGSEQAWLAVADLGGVRLEPGTRVRVDDCGEEVHRLFLERGRVRASITAEPRVFQIGTPAGLAVDLGCEYDLEVDGSGRADLSVLTGQVSFEIAGRAVFVPAGASCSSLPERGPSAPLFAAAAPEFRDAVRAVEFASAPEREKVDALLRVAEREDSLTLWHLFDAPSLELRERIFDRLAVTYPLPEGVTRGGIVGGDEEMRQAWRKVLERDWR